VYDSNYILNRHGNKPISRRVREEEPIEAFKVDLLAQDWEFIDNEKDVDKAYEEFLRIFKLLYAVFLFCFFTIIVSRVQNNTKPH